MSLEQDLNIDQNKDGKIDGSEAKNLVDFVKEEKNRKVLTEGLRSNRELFLLAKRAFERSLKDIKQKYKSQQKSQLVEDEILVLKAYLYVCEGKSIEQSGLLTDTITEDVQNLINELTYGVIKQGKIESVNDVPNPFAKMLNEEIEMTQAKIANNPTGKRYIISSKDYLEILQSIKQDYESSNRNIFDGNTDLISSLKNIGDFADRFENRKQEDILPSDLLKLFWDLSVVERHGLAKGAELASKYLKNINHTYMYDPNNNVGLLDDFSDKKEGVLGFLGKGFQIGALKINTAEVGPALIGGLVDGGVDFSSAFFGTFIAPDKTLEDIYKGVQSLVKIPIKQYLEIVGEIGEYTNQYPQEGMRKGAYLLGYITVLLSQIVGGKASEKLGALNLKESKLKNSLNELVATKTVEEGKIAGLEGRISNLRQKGAKLSLEASVPKRFSEFKEDAITKLRQICEDIKSGKSSVRLAESQINQMEQEIKSIESQLNEINQLVNSSNMSPTLQQSLNKKLSDIIKGFQEGFDKSDNSNVLRGGLQSIGAKITGLLTLLKSKLPDYMVGIGNDPQKTQKLSVEFTDIDFFDKFRNLNIIDNVNKLKDYLSDSILGQIKTYIIDKGLGEYINIEKLKENIQGGMQGLSDLESIVANNIKEAINQFVEKIRNGVARDSNGEYASLVDRLMDVLFKMLNDYHFRESVKDKFIK